MKNVSFGLMRISGMLGFLVLGLGFFYKGNHWFGLNLDMSTVIMTGLGGKGLLLLLGSMLVGFIGLLIGQGIGASIPVRSDRLSFAIDTIWHYGANVCIIWGIFSLISIGISLGEEGTQALVMYFGQWKFAIIIAGVSLVLGWLIAFQMYVVAGFFVRMGSMEFAALMARLLPIATCIFVGIAQCVFFGINIAWGIGGGLVLPFIMIPLSIHTRNKDTERRMKMKMRQTKGEIS